MGSIVHAIPVLGFVIAFVNGGNDVSKGIATLISSGVSDYRRAILWGTLWTGAGGLLALPLAHQMVATFGSGLLAPGVTPAAAAAVAVIAGAAAWVLIAVVSGLPVSTTHAIIGAIVGVGVLAYGLDGLRWTVILTRIALPLLLSPALALMVAWSLLWLTRKLARVAMPVTLDQLHWLSSGAASLARGLNDAPKIVAIVLAAASLTGGASRSVGMMFVLVTAGMVAGSLFAGRRVTTVLAERVTRLEHQAGLAASLTTAGLVAAGAVAGLPMSTTHVSSGAIVGAGLQGSVGGLHWSTVRTIVAAWVVTVPAAAVLGAFFYAIR